MNECGHRGFREHRSMFPKLDHIPYHTIFSVCVCVYEPYGDTEVPNVVDSTVDAWKTLNTCDDIPAVPAPCCRSAPRNCSTQWEWSKETTSGTSQTITTVTQLAFNSIHDMSLTLNLCWVCICVPTCSWWCPPCWSHEGSCWWQLQHRKCTGCMNPSSVGYHIDQGEESGGAEEQYDNWMQLSFCTSQHICLHWQNHIFLTPDGACQRK